MISDLCEKTKYDRGNPQQHTHLIFFLIYVVYTNIRKINYFNIFVYLWLSWNPEASAWSFPESWKYMFPKITLYENFDMKFEPEWP